MTNKDLEFGGHFMQSITAHYPKQTTTMRYAGCSFKLCKKIFLLGQGNIICVNIKIVKPIYNTPSIFLLINKIERHASFSSTTQQCNSLGWYITQNPNKLH